MFYLCLNVARFLKKNKFIGGNTQLRKIILEGRGIWDGSDEKMMKMWLGRETVMVGLPPIASLLEYQITCVRTVSDKNVREEYFFLSFTIYDNQAYRALRAYLLFSTVNIFTFCIHCKTNINKRRRFYQTILWIFKI